MLTIKSGMSWRPWAGPVQTNSDPFGEGSDKSDPFCKDPTEFRPCLLGSGEVEFRPCLLGSGEAEFRPCLLGSGEAEF